MNQSKIKNIPFKKKLFLGIGSVFLMLALIVCFLFSRTAIYTAVENDKTSSEMILERIATQIDSLYEQMDIAATSITKNPSLKSIILNLNASEGNDKLQYMNLIQQEKTIQTALGNMMFSPIISNAILYNRDKNYFYYSGSYYKDMDYVHDTLAADNTDGLLQSDAVIFRAPMQNRWTMEERVVLSVFRNFMDAATTQNTIVEIQVPGRLLTDICTQSSFKDEKEILILDADGSIVYPYDKEISTLPKTSVSQLQKEIVSGQMSHYSSDYSYSALQSLTTGFTAVLISNNHTVHQQTLIYVITTLIAVMLILSVTLLITFRLIGQVTRPLNQLIHHVNELSLDSDTILTLPSGTFDEFEIINTSFNQMVEKLKASIQKIYELQIRESNANLAALQAQVNPHFLYNALNSISAASEVYDSEITTQMCQELSSMMRYVTSKKTEVSLIEEITHMKNYLDFMKISNDTNFDYILDFPQEMHHLLIPKLSIQPFAENSFHHGFKNTMPPWNLSVTGSIECAVWEIRITDNGGGFSEEALSRIAAVPIEASELEINGLGLNNTFSRLSLYFGDTFTYHIENLSQGSRITLKGVLQHDEIIDC